MQNINPQTNGKNDKRVWWQGEVRFEGCYDEAREKRRQEGGEDGEERCLPKDEKEIANFSLISSEVPGFTTWVFFCPYILYRFYICTQL